jgi:hypothetical protein
MNANVGMMHPVFAPVSAYTPGTSITYGTGAVIAEAVSASLSWERSDGRFYGDDAQLDSDNGILGYTLDFEPTGLTDAARAMLLGETLATSEYTINNEAAPEGGFGYVRVMRSTGSGGVVNSYEGWWFYKLRFGINSEETRTKERNIEWRTPTLQGVGDGVSLDSTGKLAFAVHRTFDTLTAAISYVNGKAGIT